MKKDYESIIAALFPKRRPQDKIPLLCAMILIDTTTGDFLVCDRREANKDGWDRVICYDGKLYYRAKGNTYFVTYEKGTIEAWWKVVFARNLLGSITFLSKFGEGWYTKIRDAFEEAVDSNIILPRLIDEVADAKAIAKVKSLLDGRSYSDGYSWYADTAPWWNWEASSFRRTDVFRFQDLRAHCFYDKYDGLTCYQPFSEIRRDGTSCYPEFIDRSVALANMVPSLLNRIAELEAQQSLAANTEAD